MGGKLWLLGNYEGFRARILAGLGAGTVALLLGGVVATAQTPESPKNEGQTPEDSKKPDQGWHGRGWGADGKHGPGQAPGQPPGPGAKGPGERWNPQFDNARQALESLTPEQRKRLHENFLRWSNLSPEEKKALRERDEFRRRKMTEEMQQVISDSGLNLTPEVKEQFMRRYAEERRKMEEELRREFEEKRGPRLKAILENLKKEFASGNTPVSPVKGSTVVNPELPVIPQAPPDSKGGGAAPEPGR